MRVRRPSLVVMLMHVAAVLLTCLGQVTSPARIVQREAEPSVLAARTPQRVPVARRATRIEPSAAVQRHDGASKGAGPFLAPTPTVCPSASITSRAAASVEIEESPRACDRTTHDARGPPASG